MNMLTRFHHLAALIIGALLLSIGLAAQAGDIQDAGKLFQQGKYGPAMNRVNGYLANKPKDAQARFLKGLILTEQDKVADAIKIFSALTEDYPELPEPYNNLAVLYARQGQFDKARLALETAIRTHPGYATAHENLGDIYAKMASQAYDRALQLDRNNTSAQTKLAMIQDMFAGGTHSNETSAHNTPAPNKAEVPVLSKVEGAASVAVTAPEPANHAPVEKSIEPAPVTNNSSEVLDTVNAWAAAWSSRNAKKYLAFYADDFKTPDGENRATWETSRQKQISTPKFIHVGISNATVTFNDSSHATVEFRQSYRASHLKTSSNKTKTLLMVKSGDKWLIQEERSK